jgi:hypothetical protein
VLFDRPNFTMPFNVAGYPAISICAGFGAGGLPVAADPVPHRRRLREGHPVPQPAPGARHRIAA